MICVVLAVGFISSLLLGFVFKGSDTSRIVENSMHPSHTTAASCVVDTELKLRRVMEWHGDNLINRFIWEALLINEEVKNGETSLTDTLEIGEIEKRIATIISDGRTVLNDIGFEVPDGQKLSDLVAEALTYEEMLTVFRRDLVYDVFDDDIAYRKLKDHVEVTVRQLQEKAWAGMNEQAFE